MNTPPLDPRIRVEIQLDPQSLESDLDELRSGLRSNPKQIPSKYFYDRKGSALFENITVLPEYYPTRAEKALLVDVADEISRLTGAQEIVELGAGAATKTRVLLDALQKTGRLRLYVPFDVSETEVRRVAEELAAEYPDLRIHGIVADFVHHLAAIPPGSPRLVMLLGSTIGNYSSKQAVGFLRRLSQGMVSGDFFLLGADLIKDLEVLERAYNDSSGITAKFNRNILNVVNRITDGNFDPQSFTHSATYELDHQRIEMHLVATESHRVELPGIHLDMDISKGESIRTEISCKYDRSRIEAMLEASGFHLNRWFTDEGQLFALALAQKK